MRILFVTGSLVHGGAERHSITLANRLAERGHECSAVYVKHDVLGSRISFLLGRILVTEFRGTATPLIFKVLGPRTNVTRVHVDGGPGVYLSHAPHQVLFLTPNGEVHSDRVRLAGNVLLFDHRGLTVRIEGTHTLARALALARSLH